MKILLHGLLNVDFAIIANIYFWLIKCWIFPFVFAGASMLIVCPPYIFRHIVSISVKFLFKTPVLWQSVTYSILGGKRILLFSFYHANFSEALFTTATERMVSSDYIVIMHFKFSHYRKISQDLGTHFEKPTDYIYIFYILRHGNIVMVI